MNGSKQQNQTERIRQILVILATAGMIIINYLAGTGSINDTTPGDISGKYPTLITPADYAFSIWGLIYFGMILFSVYQALPSQAAKPYFLRTRTIYIASCAANCAWIYFWLNERILIAAAVIFILLAALAFINLNLKGANSFAETWLARVPFGIYFGWVTVASIINAAVALVFAGVEASNTTATVWACVLIAVAAILGVLIRWKLGIGVYALTIAYALTAIAVKQSGKTLIVTFCAFGVIALLIAFFTPFLHLEESRG
ncbi:MAG: tryptophan-rich sensory protein [Acidobacteriota bacterium]|nr:tryptophan-rich sensory protein [Acidobacteriota bacterium]